MRRSVAAVAAATILAAGCSSAPSPDTTHSTDDSTPAPSVTAVPPVVDETGAEITEEPPPQEIATVRLVLDPAATAGLPAVWRSFEFEPVAGPSAEAVETLTSVFGVEGDVVPGEDGGGFAVWTVGSLDGRNVEIRGDAQLGWGFSSGGALPDDDFVVDAAVVESAAVSLWEQLGVPVDELAVSVTLNGGVPAAVGTWQADGQDSPFVWSVTFDEDLEPLFAAGLLNFPKVADDVALIPVGEAVRLLEEQYNESLLEQAVELAGVGSADELDWPYAPPTLYAITRVQLTEIAVDGTGEMVPAYVLQTGIDTIQFTVPAVDI